MFWTAVQTAEPPSVCTTCLQVLWAKGYTELLERLNEHTSRTGERVEVDVYGSGPDLKVGESLRAMNDGGTHKPRLVGSLVGWTAGNAQN
jgi:hypothetical protein